MAEEITKTVTVNASGKAMAKFKAGSELKNNVNVAYFDTNEGGTDGAPYDYSLHFIIVEPIED